MFIIDPETYQFIRQTVGVLPAETGGMLGGCGCITDTFFFDDCAQVCRSSYEPNVAACEAVINTRWLLTSRQWQGVLHSHRYDMQPSGADIQYMEQALRAAETVNPAASVYFYLVIVQPQTKEAPFAMYPYKAGRKQDGSFELTPDAIAVINHEGDDDL